MISIKKNEKIKSFFSDLKTDKKKLIILIIIICLIAIVAGIVSASHSKRANTKPDTTTFIVEHGNITQVIEGSGTLEAIDQYEVSSLVTGNILSDYFEEGDVLEKGSLMYEIDASDLSNSLERANLSLQKSQLSYNESVKNVNNLSVRSDKSGTITNIYVKEGEQVSNGGKIADVIDNSSMMLSIDFISEFAKNIHIGQSADIEIVGSFSKLYGTVRSVGSGSLTNSYGVSVTPVEIEVNNPGGILSGDMATAVIGEYACSAPGTFENCSEKTILSKASGTVKYLNYSVGDYISAGSVIAVLENTSAEDSLKQSSLSLKDAQLSLDNYNDKLEDYKITAPISGKVIQKNYKAGEKLDAASSNTPMAIISDLSTLVFTISIDELDISSIEIGQKVNITADALEGQLFSGTVDNISIVGTSSNGVTSYPVKIVIDDSENSPLIPGMNVDATIIISSKENVLRVPTTAVNRGNKVTLVTGEEKEVTLGLSDGSYVEITDGLNEGDEIIVPVVNVSSDFMSRMMNMGSMMGGGMPPGNMPSRQQSGMPSRQQGGMSGGNR